MIQAKVHSTIFWKILVHFQPKFTDLLRNRQNKIICSLQHFEPKNFLKCGDVSHFGNELLE